MQTVENSSQTGLIRNSIFDLYTQKVQGERHGLTQDSNNVLKTLYISLFQLWLLELVKKWEDETIAPVPMSSQS